MVTLFACTAIVSHSKQETVKCGTQTVSFRLRPSLLQLAQEAFQ